MAVVLISNLAPIADADAAFLNDLIGNFERLGHQVVFWSGVSHPTLERVFLPSSWKIKDWLNLYPVDRLLPPDTGDIDAETWAERVNALCKQDVDDASRPTLLEILMRVSRHLLETIQPDLYLAWNPLCPHVGVLSDLCRRADIPVMMIERGHIPNTWMLDTGLLGHSRLAEVPLNRLITSARQRRSCLKTGAAVLAGQNLATFQRYPQNQDEASFADLESLTGRPRVLFLPPDDSSLGFLPAQGPDRAASLPGYTSSLDAARAVAARVSALGGITVFKPHPSFERLSLDTRGQPDLYILNLDFQRLIRWADVVVTSGSGLLHVAMSHNKPVILTARDIFSGKGIAYEALQEADIAGALSAALKRDGFAARQQAFKVYTGWLSQNYLMHAEQTLPPAGVWTAADAVAKLHKHHLQHRPSWARSPELIAACTQARPARPIGKELASQLGTGVVIASDFPSFAQTLTQRETTLAVVDFDHTLLLGNSTELYLDSIRPRWLAAAIHALIWGLQPWRWMTKKGEDPLLYRDYLRVVLMTILFPWSLLLWNLKAARIARELACKPLQEALTQVNAAPTHILSLGFRFILSPLVRAMGLPGALITAESLWGGPTIRRRGKAAILRDAHGSDTLSQAITITDSPHDADLFPLVRQGWLIDWPGRKFTALLNDYVPLRYTADAKYPGGNILRHQHFGEDLMVLLLAYALIPASGMVSFTTLPGLPFLLTLLALPLLFISFFAVYEIGYYENDFVAARRESKPTLSGQQARFARYPINRCGWSWGAGAGLPGCLLAYGAHWSSLGDTPPPPVLLPLLVVGWAAVLLATRGVFALFNRVPEAQRVLLFPVLQLAKTCGAAVVLPLSGAGLAVLMAQAFRQISNYMVYRHGGETKLVKRQRHRLIVLVIMLAGLTAVSPSLVGWTAPQVWVIILWAVHRTLREKFGPAWGQQLRGGWSWLRAALSPSGWRALASGSLASQPAPVTDAQGKLKQAMEAIEQQESMIRQLNEGYTMQLMEIRNLQLTLAQRENSLRRLQAEKELLEMKLGFPPSPSS